MGMITDDEDKNDFWTLLYSCCYYFCYYHSVVGIANTIAFCYFISDIMLMMSDIIATIKKNIIISTAFPPPFILLLRVERIMGGYEWQLISPIIRSTLSPSFFAQ